MEKITKKTVEKMNQQLLEVHEKRMKNKLNPQRGEIKFILLNDSMLRKKKYDIEVLEKNIHNLSMKTLLYTQDLTADFCIKYVLNEKYASCVEDTFLLSRLFLPSCSLYPFLFLHFFYYNVKSE